MTAATLCGEETPLVSQCLAFCQALAGQGKAFNFSLKIGSTFSFSLDTRGGQALDPVTRKKPSPSTQRRNARRREQFLKKKLEALTPSNTSSFKSVTPSSTPNSSERRPESLRNAVGTGQRRASLEASIIRQEDTSAFSNSVLSNLGQCPLEGTHTMHGDPCPLHPICPECEFEDAKRESRLPRACGFHANASQVDDSPCTGTITEHDSDAFAEEFGFDGVWLWWTWEPVRCDYLKSLCWLESPKGLFWQINIDWLIDWHLWKVFKKDHLGYMSNVYWLVTVADQLDFTLFV